MIQSIDFVHLWTSKASQRDCFFQESINLNFHKKQFSTHLTSPWQHRSAWRAIAEPRAQPSGTSSQPIKTHTEADDTDFDEVVTSVVVALAFNNWLLLAVGCWLQAKTHWEKKLTQDVPPPPDQNLLLATKRPPLDDVVLWRSFEIRNFKLRRDCFVIL